MQRMFDRLDTTNMIKFLLGALLCFLLSPYIHAAARPAQLWLYYPTNLQVDQNVEKTRDIWGRASKAGYTHILLADSKMARLGDLQGMETTYFRNIDRIKKLAGELKLEIVPALFHVGYSNDMLWHDPNLAEGLPVKDALFVVKDGQARLVADPPVSLGKPSYIDEVVNVENGVATVRDAKVNARFTYRFKVSPFRAYHVSVKIKTENFTGQPEIKALAGKRSLQWQNLGVKRTQDWKEHHVVFNSLDNTEANLYFGAWGGGKGTLQWKEWTIEEAGLVNVLRRAGAPFEVKDYIESKDYEPVIDPKLGSVPWKGEYHAWHDPLTIKTRGIADGTELRVSWHHPAIIYDGQVSCCPADPKTMELLADEAKRVKGAWSATGYMMSHDEVRTLNWDASCRNLNLDAGQILAKNARECVKLLDGSSVYVWSDMFDPHHNAVDNYYLVRGSLANSWEGLDKSVIIVNWNFDKRDASLKFFAERGHRQVIAGYYDGKVERIREWLASAEKVEGVTGVMYTTWENNYSQIENFAELCKK